uniref:Transposase n=1 Tax=Haemonchus contortus TaxID=6289 RepID=A0A7I4XU60_HAECO
MSIFTILTYLLGDIMLSDDAWQFLPEDLLFSHLHFNLRPREPPMFPPAAQAA